MLYIFVTLLLFHLVVYRLVIIRLVYGLLLPTLLKPAKETLSEKEENLERPGLVQCKVIFVILMVIVVLSIIV